MIYRAMTALLFVAFAGSLTAGCTAVGDAIKESGEWRRQVDQTVVALQQSIDTVARSVPGERWARQMEALTHPDPAVRQKALDDLTAGVGGLGKPYRVTVQFGATDQHALHARVFLAKTNLQAEVESYCTLGSFQIDRWVNSLTRPQTEEEIRAKARRIAEEIIDTSFGKPEVVSLRLYQPLSSSGDSAKPFVFWPDHALGRDSCGQLMVVEGGSIRSIPTSSWKGYSVDRLRCSDFPVVAPSAQPILDRRKRVVDLLAAFFTLHYEQVQYDNEGNSFSVDWSSTEGFGNIHVVVPESEVIRIEQIKAWLHEKDNPNSRWDNMQPMVLHKGDFRRLPDSIAKMCAGDGAEGLYWTSRNLSGSIYNESLDASLIEKLRELQKQVDDLTSIYGSRPN